MTRYCFLVGFVLIFTVQSRAEVGSADLNGDGVVNIADFLLFNSQFGLSKNDDGFITDLRASEILPTLAHIERQIEKLREVDKAIGRTRTRLGYVTAMFLNGHPALGEENRYDFFVKYEDITKGLGIPIRDVEKCHYIALHLTSELTHRFPIFQVMILKPNPDNKSFVLRVKIGGDDLKKQPLKRNQKVDIGILAVQKKEWSVISTPE